MAAPTLDLITIGRCSLDLYGQQIGGRLEDMGSFSKAVGGCPANIAVGTARLGLRSALLTRVGDEQVGRFILEQLAREGVETAGVVTDKQRLTAARYPRRARQQHLSPHLLPRQLRRYGALRGRRGRGLHRLRRLPSSSPARISPNRAPRPLNSRRSASPRRTGEKSSSTSITGRISGVSPAMTPVNRATSAPIRSPPIWPRC